MKEYHRSFEKQRRLYASFKKPRQTVISSAVNQPIAGYVVVFRHPLHVARVVAQVSRQIARLLPCICYGDDDVHTTITSYGTCAPSAFSYSASTVGSLISATASIKRETWHGVRIDFRRWLFNQDTVIAAGMPNAEFWQTSQQLRAAAKKLNLNLREPYMAHITTARFTGVVKSGVISKIRRLLNAAPLPQESRPVSLDVASYWTEASGFTLKTHARFF